MPRLLVVMRVVFVIALITIAGCERREQLAEKTTQLKGTSKTPSETSVSGKQLFSPSPSEKLLQSLAKREQDFRSDSNSADKLIWYARFLAYAGRYNNAIELYKKGIAQFPDDARMLRHRGHRLISIRKFEEAIVDLERAVELIKGKPNEIEPDGMPNEKNIPIGTLHGNIWYHLGLAYYLNHDFENALRCYRQCRTVGTNDDNVVSSTHWLYMIDRRLGREADAQECLKPIESEMKVIENTNYHRCCLFYKGLITLEELNSTKVNGPGRSAIDYAIGNWYFYNERQKEARNVFNKMTTGNGWVAFGFIAAESDLASAFDK